MTDVHDPCLAALDTPIDQIWIAACGEHAGLLFACSSPAFRVFADELDYLLNGTLDVARAEWAAVVDVLEDRLQVATRTWRVADFHRPWRFQIASISASDTNSPRRACTSPSRMAARVSSSRATMGVSSAMARTATA